MFENLSSTSVVLWIVGIVISKYLMPYLVRSNTVKKVIKVIDKSTDTVEALDASFDWKTADPPRYRPFNPVHYVTLGITQSSQNHYLKIEKTYLKATEYKRKVALQEPEGTCVISHEPYISKTEAAVTMKAVEELYDFVIGFIINKFPMYFVTTGNIVTNLINNDEIPRHANKRSQSQSLNDLLRMLCNNVEEDFMLLSASNETLGQENAEYSVRALTGIGNYGFRSLHNINRNLTEIFEPMPQYLERTQLAMNQHISKIKAGQYTQRLTWGIQIGGGIDQLYRPSSQSIGNPSLNFENDTFVSVERYVVTKLPKSNYIVLSMRRYLYSLADIKAEGSGGTLAKAIRAWPKDVAEFKGFSQWGGAVLSYLDT